MLSFESLETLPADCPILCIITIGYGISTVFLANPFGSGVVAKALRVFPNIIRGLALFLSPHQKLGDEVGLAGYIPSLLLTASDEWNITLFSQKGIVP